METLIAVFKGESMFNFLTQSVCDHQYEKFIRKGADSSDTITLISVCIKCRKLQGDFYYTHKDIPNSRLLDDN